MKKLGRPKKVVIHQDIKDDTYVLFQVDRLDRNLIKALKTMATYHDKPLRLYLNNFFKDFILHEANVIGNEGLLISIKEILNKVNYV